MTEEVHGDVAYEEVTDGLVALVLFTISGDGVRSNREDLGSIHTSNANSVRGGLSEGGVE